MQFSCGQGCGVGAEVPGVWILAQRRSWSRSPNFLKSRVGVPQKISIPHPCHGRTFSIYLCLLSFWLTLSRIVLSTYWRCPSRPCVVFLACVRLALFLALSLSPGNSLVFSWYGHSTLASLCSRSRSPNFFKTLESENYCWRDKDDDMLVYYCTISADAEAMHSALISTSQFVLAELLCCPLIK